jgi:hypothetical protein
MRSRIEPMKKVVIEEATAPPNEAPPPLARWRIRSHTQRDGVASARCFGVMTSHVRN